MKEKLFVGPKKKKKIQKKQRIDRKKKWLNKYWLT